MRSPENNLDSFRGSKNLEIKRKFILAFEGYRTEVQYFQGVNDHRSTLGIPSLIEVYPLCRFPTQSGCSSPGKVLDILEEYIAFLKCEKYSINLFINTFINDMITEKQIPESNDKIEEFLKVAKECLLPISDEKELIKDSIKAKEKCLEVYYKIFGDSGNVIFDIPAPIDYREGHDVVCVVIDRDKESRSSSECDDFLIRCRKNGFDPYMTNPCFEMWLLIHFDEVFSENVEDLRHNKKTNDIRYTEKRLDEILKNLPANNGNGYLKNNLNFYDFIDRINDAIKNERCFCNDIKFLKTNVGSNIGQLIEKMKS
jgi:hypothetical protein